MSVEVDDVWLYEMILDYLKKTEEKYPTLIRESPHFSNGDRKIIVQWISKLTKIFKIGVEAHHLAVFLFDFFIADHQADFQGLYLIGAASFSIACKVNDVEINVPQASKILKIAPFETVMQSCLLKSTEILLLQHFNWNVHKPTEASFLEYYAASCLAIELEGMEDVEYANKIAKYFNKWITYFREKILLDDEFRDYLPSKVACSIVISTRISMSLVPEWPDFMVHLTGWRVSDVIQIVNILRKGLKYDLMVEKNQAVPFCEPLDLNQDVNRHKKDTSSCSNRGDMEIKPSSASKSEDEYLHYSSSNEPITNSSTLPIDFSRYENSENYFSASACSENHNKTLQHSTNMFLNSHYVSMNIITEPSTIYVSNILVPDQSLMLPISNNQNPLFLHTQDSHEKSIESLSNACDTSFNISTKTYSSHDSYINQQNPPSILSFYQKSISEQSSDHYELPFDYLNPLSDSLSSSSSMYLILSQPETNQVKQYHSKHSHSVVVNSNNNIPARRTQNRDSIINNSMNNGYYTLKKRAPGLVINVNGAGSSYSFNCLNNTNSNHR